jgi:hypothetical protein
MPFMIHQINHHWLYRLWRVMVGDAAGNIMEPQLIWRQGNAGNTIKDTRRNKQEHF